MTDWIEWDGQWIQRGAREKVLRALPKNVLELIHEIETFAQTEIAFRDKSLLTAAGQQNTDVESLYATHQHAYISVPNLSDVNPSAVLHELLHLYRYWVDRVPQIGATTDQHPFVELAATIDNTLEHLSIVPRERDFGYNPFPYWNGATEEYWKEFPWSDVGERDRRMRCLLGWLSLPLIDSDPLISHVRQKITSAGFLTDAEKLLKRVQSLSSKDRVVSAVFRFLKIPRKHFDLVVLDIRNRNSERRAIPEH